MSKVEDFLTKNDEAEIVEAIRVAEKQTSGEIRVHLEKTYDGDQENGVLIYVAVEDKSFVIYGDKGINDVVPNNFWESTRDAMQAEFKKGDFKQGLINGVLSAGQQLQAHFPWDADDVNELSDEISKS